MADYYRQRATSGFIITEATTISPQANGSSQTPGIYTPEMVEGWKKVVQAVHDEGGVIGVQLWHQGRAGHSSHQPTINCLWLPLRSRSTDLASMASMKISMMSSTLMKCLVRWSWR